MPYNPGLGQGHGKKRHLHAHSPVNFKELKCYDQSRMNVNPFNESHPWNFDCSIGLALGNILSM